MLLDYHQNYLTPLYLLLYFFWLIKENKSVLFWLYLWQLKEYHIGRLAAHFSTHKGRRIFLNKLFALKIAVLLAGGAYYFYETATLNGVNFFSVAPMMFEPYFGAVIYSFSAFVFLMFLLEAVYAAYSLLKSRLLHPVITKKSLFLIAAAHLLVFTFAILMFTNILGELSAADFALAAFLLLLADVLAPVFVSALVLSVQPFAVLQRNKIIDAAKKKRAAMPGLLTVGIAGSYGKSSTKEFLARILSRKFRVAKTRANQNSEVGVSLAIINDIGPEHQIFVCEIGAYNKGRIGYVSNIAKPSIGILCGINEQHMATFGSQKNIIDGKYEILEVLPQDGTTILNWESKYVRDAYGEKAALIKAKKTVRCSLNEKTDLWADNIKADTQHLSFRVAAADGESAEFNLRIPGRHNIEPILLAAAAAKHLGMSLREIADACQNFEPSMSGLKKRSGVNGAAVIDSTYSSNPDGVIAHLDYLSLHKGKKAIVMPCLIELGRAAADVHRRLGQKIGSVCDFAIVTTKDYYKEIKSGAIGSGMKEENIIFSEDPQKIAAVLADRLDKNSVLLLEGRLSKDISGVAGLR